MSETDGIGTTACAREDDVVVDLADRPAAERDRHQRPGQALAPAAPGAQRRTAARRRRRARRRSPSRRCPASRPRGPRPAARSRWRASPRATRSATRAACLVASRASIVVIAFSGRGDAPPGLERDRPMAAALAPGRAPGGFRQPLGNPVAPGRDAVGRPRRSRYARTIRSRQRARSLLRRGLAAAGAAALLAPRWRPRRRRARRPDRLERRATRSGRRTSTAATRAC